MPRYSGRTAGSSFMYPGIGAAAGSVIYSYWSSCQFCYMLIQEQLLFLLCAHIGAAAGSVMYSGIGGAAGSVMYSGRSSCWFCYVLR